MKITWIKGNYLGGRGGGIGNRNNQQQIYPGGISSVHKITKLLDSLAERLANFNELESEKSNDKIGPIGVDEFRELKFTETTRRLRGFSRHAPRPIYTEMNMAMALKGNQRNSTVPLLARWTI